MTQSFLDEKSIEAVRRLAQDAAGALAPVELTRPADSHGLPEKVPAYLRTGASPSIVSAKDELEKWRTAPERRTGVAKVTNLASFIELTLRHKDAHSVIFGATDAKTPKLTAVIDYHQTNGAARFGKHRIEYAFPLSDEWKAWIENNGAENAMGQGEFAQWLEDRIAELAAPYDAERMELESLFKTRIGTPNEIIELSRGLEVCVSARVKQAVTLQSGEREIVFTEEHSNSAGEKLTVPGLFILSVPPFVDADPLRIPARLRYRNVGGALKWYYEMYRPDFWLRQQIKNDLEFAAKATELPSFEGAPEA